MSASADRAVQALAELDQVGAQIWRTDQHGTITITFTGRGPVVASER